MFTTRTIIDFNYKLSDNQKKLIIEEIHRTISQLRGDQLKDRDFKVVVSDVEFCCKNHPKCYCENDE